MVANMALPAKQPQHPPSSGGDPDHHQYAWLLRADRACRAVNDSSHVMVPAPDDSTNSWEARAFAQDASSLAAGIWPPRAYPCSFCHREFRSAQALGGHMNVHRRDRARMRHSSPPPPFCATHNISLQPATIIYKSQHGYSSSTGLNPSICPEVYPDESLSKASLLPTALPLSAMSPQSFTASLAARCPSDMAASFPLCLHVLASEAETTLMLRPQPESSDRLSRWPASALDPGNNGCHPTIGAGIKGSAIDVSSWSVPSSSSTSSSSIILNCAVTPSMGATPCRRARHEGPIIQLEDESPKKKSNTINNSEYQPYQDISLKICSKDDGKIQAHADKQTLDIFDIHVDEHICLQHQQVEADCGEYVDLELRLGQRPP